VVEAFYGATIR
jgi:hypothetical protein